MCTEEKRLNDSYQQAIETLKAPTSGTQIDEIVQGLWGDHQQSYEVALMLSKDATKAVEFLRDVDSQVHEYYGKSENLGLIPRDSSSGSSSSAGTEKKPICFPFQNSQSAFSAAVIDAKYLRSLNAIVDGLHDECSGWIDGCADSFVVIEAMRKTNQAFLNNSDISTVSLRCTEELTTLDEVHLL